MPSVLDRSPFPFHEKWADELFIILRKEFGDARSITDPAGIPADEINFKQSPIDVWKEVLAKAATLGLMRKIVQRVIDVAPNSRHRSFLESLLAESAAWVDPELFRALPEDAPYLINCSNQADAFKLRMQEHFRRTPTPVIVVLHGHSHGAHFKVAERLCRKEVPTGAEFRLHKWIEIPTKLSSFETDFNRRVIENVHRRQIAPMASGRAGDWVDAILAMAVSDNEFVAIAFEIRSSEVEGEFNQLDRLAVLLAQNAQRLGKTRLIVFVCIKY
jgi:hypothetical protein